VFTKQIVSAPVTKTIIEDIRNLITKFHRSSFLIAEIIVFLAVFDFIDSIIPTKINMTSVIVRIVYELGYRSIRR
jgi:hypothetical protein